MTCNGVPGHAGDRLAGSEQLREVEFDRVNAGDVMDHYANLSSIMGNERLPLFFGKCCRNAASAFAPASKRAARASDRKFILPPGAHPGANPGTPRSIRFVTRKLSFRHLVASLAFYR